MYPQARVFIRTALLYLAAALAVGALLQANRVFELDARISTLLPVFYHLLMLGWSTQLIFGVALWMFPPLSRERPRGDERLGWVAYAALNGGLLLRAVAEPAHSIQPAALSGWALVLSAALQTLAAWLFVAAIWPRIKGKAARAASKHSGGA